MNANNIAYFHTLGVEHFPKEIEKFIGNKNIMTNIHRIQAQHLIMCGQFCIGFNDLILKSISLLDYTNLFFANNYEKKG